MFDGYRVFDVHGHMTVPKDAYYFGMYLLGSNSAVESPIFQDSDSITSVPIERFREAAQRHVDYLDERSIDVQLIGPRPYVVLGWMSEHLIPSWARYVNDMIAQQVSFFPDRFVGACQLPQLSHAPDTRHCLEELDRCVNEFGFAAAYASPDPGGRGQTPGMHDPYWFPLYERCEELDVPIIVHGTNSLDHRFAVVPNNYQLGFVTEQYLATQFLRHSDVFDRYPRLRILVCHGGGALDRFIASDYHIPQKDLSSNLFFDTCVYETALLEATVRQRGVRQLCFGSEAPGSGGAVRPETGRTSDDMVPVLANLPQLSADDKRWIFHEGPLNLVPAFREVA